MPSSWPKGYVTARQRSGYDLEQLSALQPAEPQPRVPVKPEAPEPPAKALLPALFPFSVWAKLMRGVILDEGEALLRPMPGAGLSALRRAICDDLLRRRGMHVEPRQVYIGAGAEYFYHLLLEFFGRDRIYGLETLGHRKIARIYAASGVQCRAIAMDDDGVLPDALAASGAEDSAPLAVAPLPDRHRHAHRTAAGDFAMADGGGRPLPD